MADNPEIRVRIAPEGAGSVIAALRGVQSEAGKGASLMVRAFREIKSLLPTLGLGALVTSLALLTKRTAEFFDAMAKASERTGTTVERFSALAFAASLADASTEDLETGMRKLAKNASDFQRGIGETAESFRDLGFASASAFRGLDSAQVFALVAERIGRLPEGVDRTRVALDLLGKGGAKLIPLMKDIAEKGFARVAAEAQAFGAIVTGEVADAAKGFEDNLKLIDIASKKLTRETLGKLLPDFRNIAAAVAEAAKESNLLVAAWVALGGLGALVFKGTEIAQAEEEVKRLEGIVSAGRRLASGQSVKLPFGFGNLTPNDKGIESAKRNLVELERALAGAQKRLEELRNPFGKKDGQEDADLEESFDAAKKLADISKRVGLAETKALEDASARRRTIFEQDQKIEQAALEARLAGREDDVRAQQELDQAAINSQRRRLEAETSVYDAERRLIDARRDALLEEARKESTNIEGALSARTFEALKLEIERGSIAERLKAAQGYFQTLTNLQAGALAEYKRHQASIVALDKEIARARQDTAQSFRELQLQGLSEEQRQAERVRDANARESELRAAALGGNLEKVRELAALQKQAALDIARGGDVVPGQRFAEKADELLSLAIEKQKLLARATAETARTEADALGRRRDALKAEIEQLQRDDFSRFELKLGVNVDAYRSMVSSLQQSLLGETFRIAVTPIVRQGNTFSDVPQFASGGGVPGRSPSARADDKVVRVTSGEYIMQVPAVRRYGADFMHAVNSMRLERFADGGMVGGASAAGAGLQPVNINIAGHRVRVYTAGDEVRHLVDALHALQSGT